MRRPVEGEGGLKFKFKKTAFLFGNKMVY